MFLNKSAKGLKLAACIGLNFVMLLGSACNKGSSTVVQPVPTAYPTPFTNVVIPDQTPRGSVSGRITDSFTQSGIAGVKVEVLGIRPAITAITNASGNFTLAKVPEGRQVLVASKKDYLASSGNTNIIVQVKEGTTVTAPIINLTSSQRAIVNGFVKAIDGFKQPRGLSVDKTSGEIYVVDVIGIGGVFNFDRAEVKRINADGGIVSSFGSNLLPTDKNTTDIFRLLSKSTGIGVDAGGNIFVADTGNDVVKKYGPNGRFISSINKEFKNVVDVAVTTTGDVIVSDPGNARVILMDSSLNIRVENLLAPSASDGVRGLATDNADNIYLIDSAAGQGQVIKKYDKFGNRLPFQFGSIGGLQPGNFSNPTDLAIDNRNGDIYVVDTDNNRVQRFNTEGNFLSEFGQFGSENGNFNAPWGIALDNQGFVYVSDSKNSRIQKFMPGRN